MEENVRIALERQNPWWFGKAFETGISRLDWYPKLDQYLRAPEVLLLVGARRTGKSTLLYQIIKGLIGQKKTPSEAVLFINLDEPLFQSKAKDPGFLMELVEQHTARHPSIKKFYLMLDEVQNHDYWVQTVKTLSDTRKDLKIILTGSTSTLLRDEISTRLSGRYFHETIYPLSFSEYLDFRKVPKPTTVEKRQLFGEYLEFGSFPRVVLEPDRELKEEILKNYYQTIYLKDIIFPHELRNNRDVFDTLYFLISNVGKPFSYTKIAKTLGVAVDTVKEYIAYAEDSYLLYTLTKYDPSVKKQLMNPKKIYCIDTGMVNSISFKFSENKGRLLENLVYMNLRKQEVEVFYHREKYECDFVVKRGLRIEEAVQVSLSLKDENTRKREVRGLVEALETYGLNEGFIITENERENITVGDREIRVIPAYDWI